MDRFVLSLMWTILHLFDYYSLNKYLVPHRTKNSPNRRRKLRKKEV